MKLSIALAAAIGLAASIGLPASADAGARKWRGDGYTASEGAHPKSRVYRRGPQVRSFVARRGGNGGYSYTAEDVVNTYGDSRTRYGSASFYRDPFLDRQSSAGPFDHGFFFDSGIAPRGGDSPYMN